LPLDYFIPYAFSQSYDVLRVVFFYSCNDAKS
jgi:hypothetical protein